MAVPQLTQHLSYNLLLLVDEASQMKPIYALLAFVPAFSCFLAEAVGDRLQNDCYWCRSNYKNNIWSYAHGTHVNEAEACHHNKTPDGTIEFGPGFEPSEEDCRIYMWHAPVQGYDVNVTINYLDLNESAGNYIIISPGPSLVPDEASVVITGKIQTPKMIRVFGYSEMTLLLVIQEGITNETWKDNSFKLSYMAYGPTTEKPTTTTTKPTHNTPDPDVDYDITVYVSGMSTKELSNKTFEFKEVVAEMANKYCNDTRNNIALLTEAEAENVELLLITRCPITWPNWEKCTEILMTVEVSVPPGDGYELTRTHLKEMWDRYAQEELACFQLQVYSVPDAEGTLYNWLYISLGVAAIFTLLMIALWHFDIFNIGNKKGAQTQQDPHKTSNASNKSWVSNNSYQEVPPMTDLLFEDTDIQPTANQETAASPITPSAPHEGSPSLDQYGAAFYFQNRVSNIGYDNPSFEVSSEQHHPSNADYTDDYSSDDDSRANTSKDKKSNHDHLHKAPQQVAYKDDTKESAF